MPRAITARYPGSGDGGSSTAFNARQELLRARLALVNGTGYATRSSNEDTAPYYGWVIGYTYNGTTLAQGPVRNVSPNTGYGDSLLKRTSGATLTVAQYFTPGDQLADQQNELLNRDLLGGSGNSNAWQQIALADY